MVVRLIYIGFRPATLSLIFKGIEQPEGKGENNHLRLATVGSAQYEPGQPDKPPLIRIARLRKIGNGNRKMTHRGNPNLTHLLVKKSVPMLLFTAERIPE